MILNVLVTLVVILIFIYILKKDLGLFLVSFIILIQYLWMFLSIIVIENGIFINEQGRNGYFTYSILILFLFFISTLFSLIFFNKLFIGIFNKENSIKFRFLIFNENKIIIYGISILFILAFFNLLSSPIPLFNDGVSKFNFWDTAKFPHLNKIFGNVMGFMAFASAIIYRQNRKYSILLLFLYSIYLLFIGQKFTGFLVGSYGVLTALYFSSEYPIKFKFKWIFNKYLLYSVAVLFSLVYFYYSIKNPYKYLGFSPIESIFYRAFGLQAHVFWGTVEQYVYLNKPNTWNISELWKGMHLLMAEFWPWSHESYLAVTRSGVSWTNAYPAILIRIFPLPIALIVNFLLFSFVALIQSLLIFFIKRKSYILSIIFFQLLTWTSYAFTMSYFNKLIIPILFVILLIFYKFLTSKIIHENN